MVVRRRCFIPEQVIRGVAHRGSSHPEIRCGPLVHGPVSVGTGSEWEEVRAFDHGLSRCARVNFLNMARVFISFNYDADEALKLDVLTLMQNPEISRRHM